MLQTHKVINMANKLSKDMTWKEIAHKIMKDCDCHKPKFKEFLYSREYMQDMQFDAVQWRRLFKVWQDLNELDTDHPIVNTGVEGGGKTLFSVKQACIIDPDWSLKKLCYNAKQFLDIIKDAKRGDAIVPDEGNLFLFSREAMSNTSRFMVKLFSIMRQKNISVIINIPNFFTIESYIRDHRIKTLNWIYKRGNYKSFVGKGIRIVSSVGKRYKQIAGVKVPLQNQWSGWISGYWPPHIKEEEYRKYKASHFQDFLEDMQAQLVKDDPQDPEFITIQQARKILPMCRETLVKHLKDKTISGRFIGGKWWVHRPSLLEKP